MSCTLPVASTGGSDAMSVLRTMVTETSSRAFPGHSATGSQPSAPTGLSSSAALSRYKVGAGDSDARDHVVCMGIPDVETSASAEEIAQRFCIILDIGCLRGVVGSPWALSHLAFLREHGRYFKVEAESEHFRFGDGERRTSNFRISFEASIANHLALLTLSVIEGPCPPLYSRQGCSHLGMRINTDTHTVDMRKLSVRDHPVKVSPAGHYLLEVADFANKPLLSEVIDRGDRPVVSSSEVIVYRIPPNMHTTKRRSRTSRPCTRTDMRELINAALQSCFGSARPAR